MSNRWKAREKSHKPIRVKLESWTWLAEKKDLGYLCKSSLRWARNLLQMTSSLYLVLRIYRDFKSCQLCHKNLRKIERCQPISKIRYMFWESLLSYDLYRAVTANIVYMDRVIWRGEYGVMNNSAIPKLKPTDKTIFPIASVTKVLTVRILEGASWAFNLISNMSHVHCDWLTDGPEKVSPCRASHKPTTHSKRAVQNKSLHNSDICYSF